MGSIFVGIVLVVVAGFGLVTAISSNFPDLTKNIPIVKELNEKGSEATTTLEILGGKSEIVNPLKTNSTAHNVTSNSTGENNDFKPSGFRGPTYPPSMHGPPGPPPNY